MSKNTEFLRAITGPKVEYNGSPTTRYSTWDIGGGIKVDENPFFNKLNLSIDDQHIIDLIDTHGGNSSDWAMYPAIQNVGMDGKLITSLGEPLNLSDAATKGYVDSAIPSKIENGTSNVEVISSGGNVEIKKAGSLRARFETLWNRLWVGDSSVAQHTELNQSGNRIEALVRAFGATYGGIRVEYGGSNPYPFGDIQFFTRNSGTIHLNDTTHGETMPSGVLSILHGVHLAKDAHDALANYEWSEYPAAQNVDMDGNSITNLAEPVLPSDAATKAYVDANSGGGGGGPTIAEGALILSSDAANTSENVTTGTVSDIRFTRIGDTVTLSGYMNININTSGTATIAYTGLTGAALPWGISNWYSMITTSIASSSFKQLQINIRNSGSLRFTVVGAEATVYRTNFVITYRGAAL